MPMSTILKGGVQMILRYFQVSQDKVWLWQFYLLQEMSARF